MTHLSYGDMRPRLRPAQQELRDNLRALIADSGRSQPTVCTDAGLGIHHLSGCLTGSNWMPPERVEALADALDVSPDELLGASMYKGETWLEARRRQGGTDWRHCPRWCRGICDGVTDYDRDGRTTRSHHGYPFGDLFAISLEYDEETGEEVERTAALHHTDSVFDNPDVDLADLALLTEQAAAVARWLRGEVVLP